MYRYVAQIQEVAQTLGAELRRVAEASEVSIRSGEIVVTVTVPDSVLEWYVDVEDAEGARIHDWCDYSGYDDTSPNELAAEMSVDVIRFLKTVSTSTLRVARDGTACILQWHTGDTWSQAVPLRPEGGEPG